MVMVILKDLLSKTVVSGDPLGERKKAAGATDNPGLAVSLEERTIFGGLL